MKQVGIPLFYLQGMGGGAVLKFRDLFNDSSQFWGWRLFKGELSEVGKSGTELNGYYQLGVNPATNALWDHDSNEAPRLFMGLLTYPCEVITRLDYFTGNLNTHAELFIAKAPVGFGANLYLSIGRYSAGIKVFDSGGSRATVEITTLPVWLRMRIGCGSYNGLNVYFDYSHDGLNWTNLWVQNTGWEHLSLPGPAVGLSVRNTTDNEVVARFDHFIMRPRSIN